MGLKRYGVLRGRVVDARREDDDDTPHYQVKATAAGTDYRLAVNVKSQLSPSELLFLVDEDFRHPLLATLPSLAEGFTMLPKQPGTALDAATCSTGWTCGSCRRPSRGRTTT